MRNNLIRLDLKSLTQVCEGDPGGDNLPYFGVLLNPTPDPLSVSRVKMIFGFRCTLEKKWGNATHRPTEIFDSHGILLSRGRRMSRKMTQLRNVTSSYMFRKADTAVLENEQHSLFAHCRQKTLHRGITRAMTLH